MNYITTQRELARRVGCSDVHISNFKRRKAGFSKDLLASLSRETGIDSITLATAPAVRLDRELRKFFHKQTLLSLDA